MEELCTLIIELTSGDDERAESAVMRLPSYGENVLAEIRSLFSDPRTDIRWWAVRTLAEFSDGWVTSLLIDALSDEDQDVRQCATLALYQRPDDRAVPALICSLRDEDSLVARLAANALVAIGDPAVPALLETLRERRSTQRLEAVRALAMIGDHRAIPELFKALDEDSALVEYWANDGLERMGVGMVFFEP